MEAKFDFDDIMLPPATVSNIESRKTINININEMLPLFTAPMDTVVDETNYKIFTAQGINVVLPRTTNIKPYQDNSYKLWFSYGLSEFRDKFLTDYIDKKMKKHQLSNFYALIDIANGNMQKLIDLVIEVKKKYGNKLILMVGNVANPKTFEILSNAGADYIRCGIGGGASCHISGTQITTINNNYKNIEDLIVGDVVLTHKGTYEKISNIHILKSDDLIKINDNIATSDHKYYVLNKIYEDIVNDDNIHKYAEWVELKDIIKEQHYLLEVNMDV